MMQDFCRFSVLEKVKITCKVWERQMKNFGLKIVTFLLAFAIGASFVRVISFFNHTNELDITNEQVYEMVAIEKSYSKKPYQTSPNGKIEVNFIKFATKEHGLIAEFEVINHNTESAYFSAYSNDAGESGSPNPHVKINDSEVTLLSCGTGKKEFELKSGESKIFQSYLQVLNDYLDQSDQNIEVGYWFKFRKNKEGKIFWSKKLRIPDSMKAQLKAEEIDLKKKSQ